jgi:AraC family transcriptional activator of pobA
VAINPVRQYTLQDLITLCGDKAHDEELYVFSRKSETAIPNVDHPSRSNFYTFLLITRGKIQMRLNLIDYSIEKDMMLFLFPHVTIQFISSSEDFLYYGIAFTPDFLTRAGVNKKYLDTLDFFASNHNPQLRIKHSDANILCSSLDALCRRTAMDLNYPFRTEIVQHLFTAYLYELAAVYQNNYTGKYINVSRKEDISVQFLKLLPKHFKEERGVKFYADHLFVTPKYLSETVKEATGKTAGDFIDEMVMLEAKVLLKNPSLSIAQIAEELHFSDQFSFSKFFKREAGITPSEYRK